MEFLKSARLVSKCKMLHHNLFKDENDLFHVFLISCSLDLRLGKLQTTQYVTNYRNHCITKFFTHTQLLSNLLLLFP